MYVVSFLEQVFEMAIKVLVFSLGGALHWLTLNWLVIASISINRHYKMGHCKWLAGESSGYFYNTKNWGIVSQELFLPISLIVLIFNLVPRRKHSYSIYSKFFSSLEQKGCYTNILLFFFTFLSTQKTFKWRSSEQTTCSLSVRCPSLYINGHLVWQSLAVFPLWCLCANLCLSSNHGHKFKYAFDP